VHTEKGTLHCICPVTQERRDLAFQGFEADRNTLVYGSRQTTFKKSATAPMPCVCQGCETPTALRYTLSH